MCTCLCACVDSNMFVVALTDAHALCKQQRAVFEAGVKAGFFCPISINHSSPEALAVGD